jgi:hypothetical protein
MDIQLDPLLQEQLIIRIEKEIPKKWMKLSTLKLKG